MTPVRMKYEICRIQAQKFEVSCFPLHFVWLENNGKLGLIGTGE